MSKQTFFDAEFVPGASHYFAGFPWDDGESAIVDSMEATIFRDVLTHEHFLYEQRGAIALPRRLTLRWSVPPQQIAIPAAVRAVFRSPNVYPIPIFHDSRQLTVSRDGKGPWRILYLHGFHAWRALVASKVHESTNSVLVLGSGLPRFGVRKLVSILARRLRAPVLVFGDGDSWGLFLCSMLLRGTLVPGELQPDLAAKDVVFGGITPVDVTETMSNIQGPLHKNHSQRISAMLKYECFQSAYWQAQLREMLAIPGSVDLEQAAIALGTARFARYAAQRVQALVLGYGK